MAKRSESRGTLRAWLEVPHAIEIAIDGLTEADLNLRGGSEGWSIRETVHHLVEANLVASTIVIAALGNDDGTYDWSWLNPDRAWMERLGYSTAPMGPALETLRALSQHISGLLATADRRRRKVKLLDAPGAKPRGTTVEEVVRQQVEHVGEHLRDVRQTRQEHAR